MRALLLTLVIYLMINPLSGLARDFTIGVDNSHFFPYFDTEKNVFMPSFTKDFFEAFGREKGHTFTFIPMPTDKLLPELFLGTIDFEYPDGLDIRNRQKESRFIYFSANVVTLIDGLISFPTNLNKSLQDFKRVGILENVKPYPLLDHLKSGQMTLVTSSSAEYLIGEVLNGRLDAVYMNIYFAEHILKKFNRSKALVFQSQLPHIITETNLGSQRHPDIINELTEFIYFKGDIIKAIKAKYGIR